MTRTYLRWGSGLSIILALLMVFMQSQPYDDGDLRQFLSMLDDCTSPCWQGIRPGLTTKDEALAILQSHPWARDVIFHKKYDDQHREGYIDWRWNGRQPEAGCAPASMGGRVRIWEDRVDSIRLTTVLPFGAAWLSLGRPQQGSIVPPRVFSYPYDIHFATYKDYGMQLRSFVLQPLDAHGFWHALVDVEFDDDLASDAAYNLPCWLACA